MENFKKNLSFNLALIALVLCFCAGLGLAAQAYLNGVASTEQLKRGGNVQAELLRGHAFGPGEERVALTEENVKKAEADVAELVAHHELLRAAIAGNPDMMFKGRPTANSAELSAQLRESVDGWRKLAADNGIKLSATDPTSFGFHRYIHNQGTSPKRDFQKVDQQRQIIDFLVRQLVESRPAGAPLMIDSLDREAVETFVVIPEGKPGAGTFGPDPEAPRNENDEFLPTRTFARQGQVEALSFRIRFIAHTPTLRTFVNRIRNSGRPLVITAVQVTPTSKDIEKLLEGPVVAAAGNGAAAPAGPPPAFFAEEAPAAGASKEDKRVPVVQRKLSAFTVQVDYLSVVDEKPAANAEGENPK
jgi:hypothetical protein